MRTRRTQYIDQRARGDQDFVWRQLEKEKEEKPQKKATTKKSADEDSDIEMDLLDRFAKNPRRTRKRSWKMMDNVELSPVLQKRKRKDA